MAPPRRSARLAKGEAGSVAAAPAPSNETHEKARPKVPSTELRKKQRVSKELLRVETSSKDEVFRIDREKEKGKIRPEITRVERSSVMDRVSMFLPMLKAANEQLGSQMKDRPAADFDIEGPVDESKPYIELNLALGVLEGQDEVNEDTLVIPGKVGGSQMEPQTADLKEAPKLIQEL